jgi:hypothetical protein
LPYATPDFIAAVAVRKFFQCISLIKNSSDEGFKGELFTKVNLNQHLTPRI